MLFSQKLQMWRKSKGLSQEALAYALNVSRQAVAKWETGTAYPDIQNLLCLSDLMQVSIDYLVREQDCTALPQDGVPTEIKELIDFRLKANRCTYAAGCNRVQSTREASRDYRYAEDEFVYHDTYVGSESFAGQEAIWKNGRAVYAMNYCGRVLKDNFCSSFLKAALLEANPQMPYRGSEMYCSDEFIYRCKVNGDFTWFEGTEEIWDQTEMVYECRFHGGLIK